MRLLIAFAIFSTFCLSTPSYSMSCIDITLGPDHSVWEAVSAEFMKNSNAYTTSLLVKHVIQQKTNEGRDSLELLETMGINVPRILELEQMSDQEKAQVLVEEILPTLKVWFENTNLALKQRLEIWNNENPDFQLSVEDLIQPGIPFYNSVEKSWLTLDFGDPIPQGYAPFAFSEIKNRLALIPGKGLYTALADGMFPLMLENFIHDFLGHFKGYVENPDYAFVYRKVSQKVVAMGGWRSLNSIQRKRLVEFNELFVRASTKVVRAHLNLFHLPENSQDIVPLVGKYGYSKEVLLAEIHKLETNDLVNSSKMLLPVGSSSILRMGGVSGEPGEEMAVPFSTQHDKISQIIDQLAGEKSNDREMLIEKLRIELARYEHMLLISAEFPMQDYIEYVFAEENTELHQIFLKAGFRM